jgi:hypothetical protein
MRTIKGRILVEIDKSTGSSELINSYDHINTGVVFCNDGENKTLLKGNEILFGKNFIRIEEYIPGTDTEKEYYLMELENVYLIF